MNTNFQKKVVEYLRICDKANRMARTPFLTLEEQEILEDSANTYHLECDGGFTNNERKRYLIIPDECYETIDFEISVIKAIIDTKNNKITHSDVLGAIMNIGVEREVVGDILIEDTCIYIAVTTTMAPFIVSSLTQIRKAEVNFMVCDERPVRELVIKEMSVIVSSRRLDAIVAHLGKCSRDVAKFKITNKEVKIDGIICTKTDKIVPDDTLISIHREGRFIIYGEEGKTKKENVVLKCGKYC